MNLDTGSLIIKKYGSLIIKKMYHNNVIRETGHRYIVTLCSLFTYFVNFKLLYKSLLKMCISEEKILPKLN